jgi:hypothetical protein
MPRPHVVIFVDYENIRRGLWRHFQRRVPEDISVETLLNALRDVANGIGTLSEGHVFGDWTVRREDARNIERVTHFRAQLVLRSDSKKDRTDPVMNFAIDDFFRDKPSITNILLCAGDADYCEVVRRGSRLHKNIYVCAVGPQTAPELLSIAKAFYPIEQRLGLKPLDIEEYKEAIAKLDPDELARWTPLVRQLDKTESRLPYVVRSHFIKYYISPGLGYGDEFEQIATTLDLAKNIGIIDYDSVPHPHSNLPVRTVYLKRDNDLVKAILAREARE